MTLKEKYRRLYAQGFVPIFVADRFDATALTEVSLEAGAGVIEVTCRRPRAIDEIAQIKRRHPDLLVLAGSAVEDGPMLEFLKRRRPLMPSLAQLADAGADGFVSAMPLRPQTLGRWSSSHLLLPGVETVTEAVAALEAGAHFAKLFTADLVGGPARVRRLTSAPLHGLIPLFVTGGVTVEQIDPYVQAGAALLGSGWDLILGSRYTDLQDKPDPASLASALRQFLDAMRDARARCGPSITETIDTDALLKSLKHYHPFTEGPGQ